MHPFHLKTFVCASNPDWVRYECKCLSGYKMAPNVGRSSRAQFVRISKIVSMHCSSFKLARLPPFASSPLINIVLYLVVTFEGVILGEKLSGQSTRHR